MSQLYNYLEVIERIYNVNSKLDNYDRIEKKKFKLVAVEEKLKRVSSVDDFVAYQLLDNDIDSILAIGVANPCDKTEIEEYMLLYLRDIFKMDSSVDEMSYVIIDDMFGVEVYSNINIKDKECLFFATYLSDGKEAYLFTAIVDNNFNVANNYLFTVVRSFMRLERGSESKVIDIMKSIADKCPIQDNDTIQQLIICRFELGKVEDILLREIDYHSFTDYKLSDIYKDVNISNEIESIVKLLSLSAIQSLVISYMREGLPSLTIYKDIDDEVDEAERLKDIEAKGKPPKLNKISNEEIERIVGKELIELSKLLMNLYEKEVQYGMFLIYKEYENINIYAHSSDGKSYKSIEVYGDDEFNRATEKVMIEILSKLESEEIDSAVIELAFDAKLINLKRVPKKESVAIFEASEFDIFIDPAEDEIDIDYLEPIPELFFDLINNETEPVSSITINIDIDGKDISADMVMAKTFYGYKMITAISKEKPIIEKIVKKIMRYHTKLYTVIIKIYPDGKFAVRYLYE